MQRTFFIIPDSLWGIPVFGFGIVLALLAIAMVGWMLLVARDPKRSLKQELQQSGIVWIIAAAVVAFVLPAVQLRSQTGEPLGIAVRGYGVFLLVGVASGLALAMYRSRSRGFTPDDVMSLAMWVFIGAIVGARLFYIIEYRETFWTGEFASSVGKMLDFTRGGLVVYGSIIGGVLSVAAYCYRNRISALRMGDVVIPALFLGIFFGRLGCLMNGCCYGGRCEDAPYALYFPPGSPVYGEQLMSGELVGMSLEEEGSKVDEGMLRETVLRVTAVREGSLAAQQGIRVGSRITKLTTTLPSEDESLENRSEDDSSQLGLMVVADGVPIYWTAEQLPETALAVRPAQIISSLSGLLICVFLLALSALVRLPDGVLSGVGLATYAVARFGEEIVRSDEPGQFGTALSISQWVSIVVFPLAVAGIVYIYWRRPEAAAAENGSKQITEETGNR